MLKENLLKFLKLDSLIENVTGYVESRIELLRIEIKEELAEGISRAIVYMLILLTMLLFVFLISMAVAFKIAESVGAFAGFGIVGGFYFLVGLVMYLLRDPIAEKIQLRLNERMNKKKQ
jgi:positive regulator of sigma E activity